MFPSESEGISGNGVNTLLDTFIFSESPHVTSIVGCLGGAGRKWYQFMNYQFFLKHVSDQTANPRVGGSIPPPGTSKIDTQTKIWLAHKTGRFISIDIDDRVTVFLSICHYLPGRKFRPTPRSEPPLIGGRGVFGMVARPCQVGIWAKRRQNDLFSLRFRISGER